MTLRAILVAINILAWGVFVVLRPPMPESYFTEIDKYRYRPGHFSISDVGPDLIVAGRPLWGWSEFHGGERTPVKVLEVLSLLPLLAITVADIVLDSTAMSAYTRSQLVFGGLLILSSLQRWLIGSFVMDFRTWRRERHAAR